MTTTECRLLGLPSGQRGFRKVDRNHVDIPVPTSPAGAGDHGKAATT